MGEEDGTSFTIDIPVKGENDIENAAKAVEVLAARLADSKTAFSAAEKSADMAAKAVERLQVAAEGAKGKKLEQLHARLAEATTQSDRMKASLAGQAGAFDKLQAQYDAAKKHLDELKKKGEGAGHAGESLEIFEKLERPLRKLGGPLAELSEGFIKTGAGIGKLIARLGAFGAIVAATVLVVAFTAAVGEAVKKVAEFGVELSNEHRSAELLAQGTARSVKGGTELLEKIEQLNRQLPLTEDELKSTAQRLADAGFRGEDLTRELQNAAVAAAKLKFGPDFQREMLSLGQQSKVFKANLAGVFGGLNLDKLLEGLQTLVALFDASTASGRAIKVVFESIFQPLVDGAGDASTKIEGFFLQFEILALKALIAIKPYGSVFVTLFEVLAIGAAVIVGTVVAAFVLVGAAVGAVVAFIGVLVYGFEGLIEAIPAAFNAIIEFVGTVLDVGFEIAGNIVDGLVNGLARGASAVFKALKGVVIGAVDGAKKLLGISSPSKVMEAEVGFQMGAGAERGITRAAPGVRNALEDMVEPPTGQETSTAPAAPAASTGRSTSVTGNTFVFNGVKDAEDAESRIGALLTRLLEGDASTLGGMVPSGG